MKTFYLREVLRDEAAEANAGGGDQKFDPAAFQSSLMAALLPEIDKRVNGLDKRYDKRLKDFETSFKPKEEPKPEEQHQEQGKGAPDLEKQALQKRLDAMEKTVKETNSKAEERERAAEQKERHSEIRSKLSGMGLAGDAEIATAFSLFRDEVRRDEEGNLVAGPDNEPFDKYMRRQIDTVYNFLLPRKDVTGAGAARGNGNQATGFDLDSIKPNMKPEDRSKLYQEMRRASG